MANKTWVRLDNASNIFLASRNDLDTKVFRISAELKEPVQTEWLQKALDKTYDQYALYHSVLRRGFFWYYLEESHLRPKVSLETQVPCAQIYHFDRKELLFRVLVHHKRIHLEVFHALSDGTGASWFLEDLVKNYITLAYPEALSESQKGQMPERLTTQIEDGFVKYFRPQAQKIFKLSAQSALQTVTATTKKVEQFALRIGKRALYYNWEEDQTKSKVYQIKGTKTPDLRMNTTELEMPVDQLLVESRKIGVSLTIYLSALYFLAIYKARAHIEKKPTLTLSIPVNLRQFFPTYSARNFFTAIHLSYTFKKETPELETVCLELSQQLKNQLTQTNLEKRLGYLLSFEFNPVIRFVYRPLKDSILKIINWLNNRKVTVSMSNLGRMIFAEEFAQKIDRLYFQTASVRPQFSMISFENKLSIVFTSPFMETDIQKTFVRLLTEKEISVVVAASPKPENKGRDK
ncbi:hypothetical protein [Lacticigenium naphthae]|uniref:hypothetical protein n=1 Tax=Lacticigenium naphthae TaxID=515351 RepID=UPI000412A6DB|nr:hypothetical protein [Lacticigenium naphthae]